jgi:hypothetical protein
MFLYDDIFIKVLDVLVLLVLLPWQYLLAARVFQQDWDEPAFWLEAVISCITRPFSSLADFGRAISRLFERPAAAGTQKPARHPIGKVLLGLLLAVPVLLLAGGLLISADQVFASLAHQLWARLSIGELGIQAGIAFCLLPFIFSFLYSGRSHQRLFGQDGSSAQNGKSKIKVFRTDKTILITFLSCINLLYICFAAVQLAYLTGAFQAVLPDNLTYAEYARSGFFELAAICVVNLALILLAIKGADRQGAAGLALRVESLLLVAGSLVQWASAMFRMKMYIDIYGLTLLRFWVTAFMLLLLVLFLLMLVKEFMPAFPLFKTAAAALLISLLALNHANGDAWIARHNIDLYRQTGRIDTAHFRMLSSGAVPAMIDLTAWGEPKDTSVIAEQLLSRYDNSLADNTDSRWQRLNVSQEQASKLIAEHQEQLDRLKAGINSR